MPRSTALTLTKSVDYSAQLADCETKIDATKSKLAALEKDHTSPPADLSRKRHTLLRELEELEYEAQVIHERVTRQEQEDYRAAKRAELSRLNASMASRAKRMVRIDELVNELSRLIIEDKEFIETEVNPIIAGIDSRFEFKGSMDAIVQLRLGEVGVGSYRRFSTDVPLPTALERHALFSERFNYEFKEKYLQAPSEGAN